MFLFYLKNKKEDILHLSFYRVFKDSTESYYILKQGNNITVYFMFSLDFLGKKYHPI